MRYIKTYENLKTIRYKDMGGSASYWDSHDIQVIRKNLDKEFFDDVFADLIDDGAGVYSDIEDDNYLRQSYEIRFKLVDETSSRKLSNCRNISQLIDCSKNISKRVMEIESFVKRIKDEYPYVDHRIFYNDNNIELSFFYSTVYR